MSIKSPEATDMGATLSTGRTRIQMNESEAGCYQLSHRELQSCPNYTATLIRACTWTQTRISAHSQSQWIKRMIAEREQELSISLIFRWTTFCFPEGSSRNGIKIDPIYFLNACSWPYWAQLTAEHVHNLLSRPKSTRSTYEKKVKKG